MYNSSITSRIAIEIATSKVKFTIMCRSHNTSTNWCLVIFYWSARWSQKPNWNYRWLLITSIRRTYVKVGVLQIKYTSQSTYLIRYTCVEHPHWTYLREGSDWINVSKKCDLVIWPKIVWIDRIKGACVVVESFEPRVKVRLRPHYVPNINIWGSECCSLTWALSLSTCYWTTEQTKPSNVF